MQRVNEETQSKTFNWHIQKYTHILTHTHTHTHTHTLTHAHSHTHTQIQSGESVDLMQAKPGGDKARES